VTELSCFAAAADDDDDDDDDGFVDWTSLADSERPAGPRRAEFVPATMIPLDQSSPVAIDHSRMVQHQGMQTTWQHYLLLLLMVVAIVGYEERQWAPSFLQTRFRDGPLYYSFLRLSWGC
jgi:hypothetical protein